MLLEEVTQSEKHLGLRAAWRVWRNTAATEDWAVAKLDWRIILQHEPFTLSIASSLPYLRFAIRLDPLSAFFVLTISVVGLAVSVYAIGALYNAFLLVMTLVVLADNGFFFLFAWELMSLVSYFLVVTDLLIDRSEPLAANIACRSYSINLFDLLHLKNSARTNRRNL